MRRQLAFFAAVLCLPILAFVAYVLISFAWAERDRVEATAETAARSLAGAIDRELLGLSSALEVLALSPQLQTGDLARFYEQASAMAVRLRFNTVVRTPDGQQLINVRRPFNSSLPRTPSPEDEDVLASDRPLVLDLFAGQVADEPLFGVARAIRIDEQARYILSLAVPAERIRELVMAANLPATWTIAVVDNNDVILARNQNHEEYVGKPATQDLRDNTADYAGSWEALTLDGQAVFGAYARSIVSNWRVAIGVRTAELNAPVWRSVGVLTLIGLLALSLAVLMASVFAHRISRTSGELAFLAGNLATGEPVKPITTPIREFERIGTAIVGASEALRQRERALRESEAKFRAIADAMPQMVWSTTPDGLHDYYNARWYDFTGAPAGSTDGEGWNDMFHPDDQERAWQRWRHSLETGEPYEIEYRLRHYTGQYRWTLGLALPIRDEDRRITRWFGTCTDIHEKKIMAEEREIVAQELNHRIKNIFSVLSSIVSMTGRAHPQARDFVEELRQRILALGVAHDFVRQTARNTERQPSAPTLHQLMQAILAAYNDGSGRIVIGGDDVPIAEGAATPLALIFHELGTNAAKYGALAATGGALVITCRRTKEMFEIDWKETATAQPAAANRSPGFGTRLIDLSVKGQMSGDLESSYEADGLRVTLKLPIWALERSAQLSSGVR